MPIIAIFMSRTLFQRCPSEDGGQTSGVNSALQKVYLTDVQMNTVGIRCGCIKHHAHDFFHPSPSETYEDTMIAWIRRALVEPPQRTDDRQMIRVKRLDLLGKNITEKQAN